MMTKYKFFHNLNKTGTRVVHKNVSERCNKVRRLLKINKLKLKSPNLSKPIKNVTLCDQSLIYENLRLHNVSFH